MKEISLRVPSETVPGFSTMLQSGIQLSTAQGTDIATMLLALPVFTVEYLAQRVKALFLNGLPANDLHQQLFGTDAVIALMIVSKA